MGRTQTLPQKSRGVLSPSEKVSAAIPSGVWGVLLQKRGRTSEEERWEVQERSPGGKLGGKTRRSHHNTAKEAQSDPLHVGKEAK